MSSNVWYILGTLQIQCQGSSQPFVVDWNKGDNELFSIDSFTESRMDKGSETMKGDLRATAKKH